MSQPSLFESPKHKAILTLLPGFTPRPKLRLPQVEAYLKATQAMGVPPSKQTLINWLEEGRLLGTKVDGIWLVDRESFQNFLAELDSRLEAA